MVEYDYGVVYQYNKRFRSKTFDKWAGVLKFLSDLKISHVDTLTVIRMNKKTKTGR